MFLITIDFFAVIEVACGEYGDYVPRLAEGVSSGLCDKLDAAFTVAFAHQRYFLSRIDEELAKNGVDSDNQATATESSCDSATVNGDEQSSCNTGNAIETYVGQHGRISHPKPKVCKICLGYCVICSTFECMTWE